MAFPHIYPDPESRALRTLLAEECGVPIGNILVGCGADELIDLLMRCVLSPGACAYPPPLPSSYEHVRVCVGGGVAFSKHVGTHTPSATSQLPRPRSRTTPARLMPAPLCCCDLPPPPRPTRVARLVCVKWS
jgi:hypothetical protein